MNDATGMHHASGPMETMPMLFVGHGNPMNAVTENEFTRGWREVGESLPEPAAILCISAHWETRGTFVTAMEKPPTIHDFGGFPRVLYEVEYPAPGNPGLARDIHIAITGTTVGLDQGWGLDHGCWSILRHLFPKANIPVVQMSLDSSRGPERHYALARELSPFRRKGVMIVGSGNIVHNLRMADWQMAEGFAWASEASDRIRTLVAANEHQALVHYPSLGEEIQLAIPTPEHYLPLLYILGLKEEGEEITFFNDKIELGSISMTSVAIGTGKGR